MPTKLPRSQWPTVAILLAAGSGTRSGLDYPKQFLRIGGLTILEHTLQVFERSSGIDHIVIVGQEDWLDRTRELAVKSGASKVLGVISGGSKRSDSTQCALAYLSSLVEIDECKVLIHDAVRPLIDEKIIEDTCAALDGFDAVDVVIETADTIVEVADGQLAGIPDRNMLRRGQTPQGFVLSTLLKAYERADQDSLERFTDDCAVVLSAFPSLPIKAVSGSDQNIKITTSIDVYLADRLLQIRDAGIPQVGLGNELQGSVVVFGGTSGIGRSVTEKLRARGVEVMAVSRRDGVDVRSEADLLEVLGTCRRDHGPIQAVVNSAGVLTKGNLVDLEPDDLRTDIDINLLGNLYVARASYPYLKETGGHLLMFTSSSYTRGRAQYAAYCATKAGVVSLTQALAEEWHEYEIKVNCINPARTSTPMRSAAFGDEPPETLLSAEEVARESVKVLESPVTGHIFDVRLRGDGG